MSLIGHLEVFLLVILRTYLGSLDVSFDSYNDGTLEVLLLECSPGSSDGKWNGFGEGIKLVCNDGKVHGTILAKCRYNHTWS